jgi:Neuraminidase (sialidase)
VQGCFDQWGAILRDGSAIMVMGGYVPGHDDNVWLFRSADGGHTWAENPLGLEAHHDHPMVIAQDNQVYVVSMQAVRNSAKQGRSTVSVVHSQDGAKTFGPPTRVMASNLGYEATGPALLSDGMFVVGFHDHNRPRSNKWLVRPRSWMVRSADQGRTFSEPLLVSESCESRGGWPSAAVDSKDRLFWLCIADKFNGVLVQRSDDRGESWSEPTRANHSETARSFTPSIAVNKNDVIGVSWYEIHDKNCFDVYFTASLDGGKTFLPEVRVSSAISCPDTPQNKGVFDPGMTFGAGGDYSGLAATSDGIFHVVWSDARTGIYQLRTASVAVKP